MTPFAASDVVTMCGQPLKRSTITRYPVPRMEKIILPLPGMAGVAFEVISGALVTVMELCANIVDTGFAYSLNPW